MVLGNQLAPPPVMTAAALRGVHVAIAGDERDALEFLAQPLRYHGALVTTHDPARTVLRLMQILLVNVLIVDLSDIMDDGLKLIRDVRSLSPRDGGRVPLIALFAGPSSAEPLIVAEDVDSVIRKPVGSSELVRVVASVVAASPGSALDR
jgi:DNA-binding response OmpR family regulator